MALESKAAQSKLLAVFLLILAGCQSNSPPSTEEALRRAQACMTPDTNLPYLPAARPDFEDCLEKAMREPAGRRFLLDAGNEAVARWSSGMARFVGEDLALDPNRPLRQALAGLRAVPAAGGTGQRVGEFYEQLVRAVFANVKHRRDAAAEVAGTMESFISHGSGKPADPFIRSARERLPGGDEDKVTRELAEIIRKAMEELVAISFWADERIRSELLAGDSLVSPATSPPATTPALEDPPGELHIPGPDQQPAHGVFFDWYEQGSGRPLATAAATAIEKSGILERFLT